MTTKNDAIVKSGPTALAPTSAIPEFLRAASAAPRGLESVDREDLMIPRLVLCQDKTPEVEADLAQIGDILNSISKEILLNKADVDQHPGHGLRVIPIILTKSRIKFDSIKNGGKVLCRAPDALKALKPEGEDQGGQATADCTKCVHKEWDDTAKKPEDQKPECTLFYNVLCLLPDFDMMPVVWSGKSTNIKVMKRFLSTARSVKTDFFARIYNLFPVDDSAGSVSYQNWNFQVDGWVTKEQYAEAEAFFKTVDTAKLDYEGREQPEEDADIEVPAEPTPPPAAKVEPKATQVAKPAAKAEAKPAPSKAPAAKTPSKNEKAPATEPDADIAF